MAAPTWGYAKENGPSEWDKWYPIAENGTRQSPIDLSTSTAAPVSKDLKPLASKYPKFAEAKFMNNGHSVQFQPTAPNTSELSGGPLAQKYRFEQFHFHWGSKDTEGSEHRVNGAMYPAELHFVHWNCEKYDTFQGAVGSGDGSALCVLGFFLKVGKENAALKPVLDLLPKLKNAGSAEIVSGEYDIKPIMPSELKNYWTYDGSLTTPPLLELVKWVVFKEPLEVSQAQMDAFRAVIDRHGEPMSGNYRPPCPLHGRTVKKVFSA